MPLIKGQVDKVVLADCLVSTARARLDTATRRGDEAELIAAHYGYRSALERLLAAQSAALGC